MNIILPELRARTARGEFSIEGSNVLADLEQRYIIDFSYTDSTSDKADDISIKLADPHGTWMQKFISPKIIKQGIKCTAKIVFTDWTMPGDNRELDCGIFWISNIGLSGPFPNIIDIKASSVPPNGIKGTKKFKAWEGATLQDIAAEIATSNELTLFYDTQDNPRVKRIEQKDQPDLEFLRNQCKEAKLNLKVHKSQVIVYSEEEYESREPAFEIRHGASNLLEYSFEFKSDDTFDSAKESYVDPETGKLVEEEIDDPLCDWSRQKLNINEGVKNEPDDDSMRNNPILYQLGHDWSNDPIDNKGKGKGNKKRAKKKAEAKLREKNKKAKNCSLKTHGNSTYLSGINHQTIGFGVFDLKWFIESSTHTIGGSGYTTDMKCRHCLKGY